jgi:hypothetical protein
MSWIILTQPHPLDRFWSDAIEAVDKAQSAMDALGSDFTDEALAVVAADLSDAIRALMALPARSPSDSLYKLKLAGVDNDHAPRVDCDFDAIMNEATSVLDVAVARGAILKASDPDLLEGVTL